MSGVSRKSNRKTSKASPNATSSPASASGALPLELLDGQTIFRFGQEAAPAQHSVRAGSGEASAIRVTCGPHGAGSLASVALSLSLASRLRKKTDSLGSTLFRLNWKQGTTPSGRRVYRLAASALRTSERGFTSWPTPMAGTPSQNGYNEAGNTDSGRKTVALVGWPTPDAGVFNEENPEGWEARRKIAAEKNGNNGFGLPLAQAAQLLGWPTPQQHDAVVGKTAEQIQEMRDRTGAGVSNLNEVARLAAWPTPRTPTGGAESAERKQELGRTASGGSDLQAMAQRTSWATPRAEDAESAGTRHSRGVSDTLTAQSRLATWVSPTSRDWKDTPGMATSGTNPDGSARDRADQLPRQVQQTVIGETQPGSDAATAPRVLSRLNPRFSLWLMGLPVEEWASCGEQGTRLLRQSRRGLSGRSSRK